MSRQVSIFSQEKTKYPLGNHASYSIPNRVATLNTDRNEVASGSINDVRRDALPAQPRMKV